MTLLVFNTSVSSRDQSGFIARDLGSSFLHALSDWDLMELLTKFNEFLQVRAKRDFRTPKLVLESGKGTIAPDFELSFVVGIVGGLLERSENRDDRISLYWEVL